MLMQNRQDENWHLTARNNQIVKLLDYEFRNASLVGYTRTLNALLKNGQNYFPEKYEGQAWYNGILGACGEVAVAKFLNVYWGAGVDTFKQPDLLGYKCEIRTTRAFDPCPKIRSTDSGIVIAVIASANYKTTFKVWGWLYADEAKQDAYYYDDQKSTFPKPCWFPPLDVWHEMHSLPKESKND